MLLHNNTVEPNELGLNIPFNLLYPIRLNKGWGHWGHKNKLLTETLQQKRCENKLIRMANNLIKSIAKMTVCAK